MFTYSAFQAYLCNVYIALAVPRPPLFQSYVSVHNNTQKYKSSKIHHSFATLLLIPYVFRVQLAALHFKENSNHAQATTKQVDRLNCTWTATNMKFQHHICCMEEIAEKMQEDPHEASSPYCCLYWKYAA